MKKLPLHIFLVLMFSLFTSHSFAEIKYKTYKKLPCNFNGAKVGTRTIISFKKTSRCTNWTGYPLKRGTSVIVKRGTPLTLYLLVVVGLSSISIRANLT